MQASREGAGELCTFSAHIRCRTPKVLAAGGRTFKDGEVRSAAGRIDKLHVATLAGSQFGRISWAQLRQLGAGRSTIGRWLASGYLIRVLPGVYAVGHVAPSRDARLFELVLWAGPGASLSHGTAAWWRGLLSWPVSSTHISTPRYLRTKLAGDVALHLRRDLRREVVNGVPVTTVAQTLLDLAASEPFKLVRRALAQLDYTGAFDRRELSAVCARGRPGSAALMRALRRHLPELARTRSELEAEFLLLCERYRLPLPLMNRKLYGEEPDAWWPDFKLVVEIDGDDNHRTPAQRSRDRRKELVLRAHGLIVLRYDYDLIMRTPPAVKRDLVSQMSKVPKGRAGEKTRSDRPKPALAEPKPALTDQSRP